MFQSDFWAHWIIFYVSASTSAPPPHLEIQDNIEKYETLSEIGQYWGYLLFKTSAQLLLKIVPFD